MSGRRHVQTGLEEEDSDSEKEPLSKTFSSSKRGSRDGASKRGRTPDPDTAPAVEPAAKRQHSSKDATAEDEAAAADHEPYHQPPGHAEPSAEAAENELGDPTPFVPAAAAGTDDAAVPADDAAPAAAGKPRRRGSKGSKQPAGKQSPWLQRQNSKLDSRNLVKAAKKPNNKASKQPKPRALKEPVASADTDEDADSDFPSDPDGRMSAFTKDVWDGYYGEDPWGDGRDGPEDNKPPQEIEVKELPTGKAAVGWGYWEWYTDERRWFRLAVCDYDPQKKHYLSLAEDGEVVPYSAKDWEKWPDDTRVFCIPPHQEQQQDDEAGQPSEQEEQAALDAKELVGAAFESGQAGDASTPTGKGKGKRKAPAQQGQQPRSKQRKAQQQQQQQQQQREEHAAEQQQHEEGAGRSAHGDEAANIAAAAAQAAAAVAAGEGVPAGEPAAAAAAAAAAAGEGDGAAEGTAVAASGPAGKKQQRTPKKQQAQGRPASGVAAASTKARKAAAAQQQQQTLPAAAGEDVDGAEQQQDHAVQLQQCLEQLHGAVDMLRVAMEQQQKALQGIADMNLSAKEARQFAAQASRGSPACQQALKLLRGTQYQYYPAGFPQLVGDVKKLGTEQMRLFGNNSAPPPSSQQQKSQQRQQQQGKAAGQQQLQQQRKDRPSSGVGAPGQPSAGRHLSGPNGVTSAAAAAAPAGDLSVFLDTCAQLVPLTPLYAPTRDKAVALLAAVLQPQQGFSPFAVAQQLEQRLQQRYGSRQQQGQQGYMRHLQVLWDVLGGGDMEAAEAADKAAQDAAAEADAASAAAAAAGAAEDDELQLLKTETEQKAAAAAGEAAEARARFEGVPGDASGAALRRAVLEGRLSAQELFDVTAKQLAAEAKAVQ